MIPYKNLGWDSNVKSYLYDENSITVQFKTWTHKNYCYTHASATLLHVENMKKLADAGKWLNSYIGKNKPTFSFKK